MTQSTKIFLVSLTIVVQLLSFQLGDYVECELDVLTNQRDHGKIQEETTETVFCQNFVRSKGYRCEEHKFYTDDGFALLLHRVRFVQPPSPTGSEDGSTNNPYDQNSLKVAVSHRMRKKDKSRLTSEVKFDDWVRNSGPVTNDFVSERAQPYQGPKSDPISRSTEVIPTGRAPSVRRSLGGDARDSPDNLPLFLPPEVTPVDSVQNPGPVNLNDFVSERAEPYQGAKTDPHARSIEVLPIGLASPQSSRGGDARDSPENLPLFLPPHAIMNPAVDVEHSSSKQPFADFGPPIPTPLSEDGPGKQRPDELFPRKLGGIPCTTEGPSSIIPSSEETSTSDLVPTMDKPTTDETTLLSPIYWYMPRNRPLPSPLRDDYSGPTSIASPSSNHPYSVFLSPEIAPGELLPHTFSPAPSDLGIPSHLPGPIDQTPTVLGPVVPGPTTISSSAPPFPGYPFPTILSPESPPEFDLPILLSPAPSGLEIPSHLPALSPSVSEAPASGVFPAPSKDDIVCSVVLLLHHELLNGDSWFKEVGGNKPSAFLPFLLADDGFDVWVGHGRATYWSHDHLHLDTSNYEYWDWTWDEFVQHDVPTMLRYINNNTQSKVHIVGVSQSAAVVVAAATQPDLAPLMKSVVLLGPSIYHGRTSSSLLESWARIFAKVTEGPDSTTVSGQFNISRDFNIHSFSLGGPASMISGPDCCISSSVTLFDNGWDGTTSYKNFQHFEQGVFTNTYQHYDYGTASRNQEAYGQPTPAAYSPANVPADLPLQVIYGGNDFVSSPTGIQELLVLMPRLPATVYLPTYAHFDLFFSSSRNDDVYRPIRSFLQDPALAISPPFHRSHQSPPHS